MKIVVSLFVGLFLLIIANTNLYAQNHEITFILLRHAEKDVSPGADKVDPELSAEGRQRADRLVETIRKYKPTYFYSTNFKRTRATVTPLAENLNSKYRQQIQIYDYVEQSALIDQLLKSNVRTVVIVGHNSTIPVLANTLIKREKYKTLGETEYNKIWVIKVKKNKIRDVLMEY